MFFGRKKELAALRRLRDKDSASLVCVQGRRRIGKSTLIEEFGKEFSRCITIQGLAPEKNQGNQEQLNNFATSLSLQFNTRREFFEDWSEAFHSLAQHTTQGDVLICLDEVSWMGRHDPLFAAKLKAAWDLYLKKNPKAIVAVCGSVSTWIEENILQNANFEGRISLTLQLGELSLQEINHFWEKQNFQFSSLEKMLILSVAGGVPKYLEELVRKEGAESNILSLCFTPSGMLFNEYEHIFASIFERRTESLERIVRICSTGHCTPAEIARKLGKSVDGHLSQLLQILECSGFASRDYYFNLDGTASHQSHIRIKDNYLRFYLKHIEPNKQGILKGGRSMHSLFELNNFESVLGYQFENLILANRHLLYSQLGIDERDVISAAPHRQRSSRHGSCQIDLLIQSTLNVLFLCECKCKKYLESSTIIKEMKKKLATFYAGKKFAVKPVLIYQGEVVPPDEEALRKFFFRVIPFERLYRAGGATR